MFSGIIEARGRVVSLDFPQPTLARLTVAGADWLGTAPLGASVAVDGVCLTVVGRSSASAHGPVASFEIMLETLTVTTLAALAPGALVNLERALAVDGRLDGHVVQGHVDGVSAVLDRTDEPGNTRLRVSLPEGLAGLVARKGSVALAGVSLTVSDVSAPGASEPWCEVALIPATLDATGLGAAFPGGRLNLEVDVLARYAARLTAVTASRGARA